MPPQNALERLTPDRAAVERFARDWHALTRARCSDLTVVAVSGGADSTALLLLLHDVIGQRCIAATVDHRLRAESGDEARRVADLCRDRGIAHTVLSGPLADRTGRTANVSARARELRYDLLERHAASIGAAWIATAHHADDQLETLVMRLNRGAGVGGMSGIRAVAEPIVRPLLGWRHAELAALVAACGITPVDDPTNSDDRFDRARLRKRLATTEWLDPAMAARTAAALSEADESLVWATDRAEQEFCRYEHGSAAIRNVSLPPEILRRLVLRCLRHVEPGIAPRGGELTRFLTALRNLEPAMIGTVSASPATVEGQSVLRFRPAPPRRNT